MSADLKPCPFCGGKATIGKALPDWHKLFKVRCADDNCIGSTIGNTMYLNAQAAADAWNRRSGAAESQRGEWKNGCECSICGVACGPHNATQKEYYHFCPNCGARMEGENEGVQGI